MSEKPAMLEFDAIYARLRGPVLSLGYQMIGDAFLAEDVLQETFLLVHRFLPQFRGESDVATWVYRIAIRTALRMRQKRSRTPVSLADMHGEPSSDKHPTPAAREEDVRRLYDALDRLPLEQRVVITLLSIREIPVRQVAEILSVPEGTIWSRAHHARRKLRELLTTSQK